MLKSFQAVSYIRLSREDGDNLESESISNQRNIICQFLENQKIPLIKEFVDDGKSGGNFNRPAFLQMIEFLKQKKANMVITKDLSRLGRDYIGTGYYIEHFFLEREIRYYAILDQFDTFNQSTLEMTPIKIGINDMYAKDISKKVRSVIQNKQRQGKYTGAIACYGYKKDLENKGKLIIDSKEASNIRKIFNWYINGIGPTEIAYRLTKEKIPTPIIKMGQKRIQNCLHPQIWQTKSIYTILKNEMYIGKLIQGKTENISYKSKKRRIKEKEEWRIIDHHHDVIIDPLVFYTAQKIMKSHTKYCVSQKDYKLKKLLYCKECNHSLGIQNQKQKTICNYYKKYSRYHYCTPHIYSYFEIEREVEKRLRYYLSKFYTLYKGQITKKVDQYLKKVVLAQDYKKELLDQIEKINWQRKVLYQDRLDGIIDKDMYIILRKDLDKQEIINRYKIEEEEKKKKIFNLKEKEIDKIIYQYFHPEIINKLLISILINKIQISQQNELTILYNFKKI